MEKIRFSHCYTKLNAQDYAPGEPIEEATLLDVSVRDLADLSSEFLAYDTDNGLYHLDPGKYLLLILKKSGSHLFTTLRKYTPEKYESLKSKIGNKFEIWVKD